MNFKKPLLFDPAILGRELTDAEKLANVERFFGRFPRGPLTALGIVTQTEEHPHRSSDPDFSECPHWRPFWAMHE